MNIDLSFKLATVAPLVLLVLWAVYTDLKERKISNGTSLLLLLFFFPSAWVYQFSLSEIGWHLAAGLLVLLVFIPFFIFGQIGGGDIKLIAAVLVWYGLERSVLLLFYITASGGIMALLIMPIAIILRRNDPTKTKWRERYSDIKLPYAVAIALGVAMTFSHGWWFER